MIIVQDRWSPSDAAGLERLLRAAQRGQSAGTDPELILLPLSVRFGLDPNERRFGVLAPQPNSQIFFAQPCTAFGDARLGCHRRVGLF